MSTGRPPAPDVASIATSLPSLPAGRDTGRATPVEVSLWAQPMRSTESSEVGSGAVPGSELTTTGSARNGAPFATEANFAENSPKVRCSERSRISPTAAASQKAVVPPLPRTTS